jgi:hypothetical protein
MGSPGSGGLTEHSEIPDQLVRVWSVKEVLELQSLAELATDDRRDVKVLEWHNMVSIVCGSVFDICFSALTSNLSKDPL